MTSAPTAADVAAGVGAVRARIAATGRDPDTVTIVAVTKGFGADAVHAAAAAGVREVGENQAQQLLAKIADGAPEGVRWHYLGAVQRNKVKALAPHVALWHAVDRQAAGATIAKHRPGASVLVQVNLTGAEQRAGCGWDEAPAVVGALREEGLDVRGLMGVAGRDHAEARRQFRRLAELARDLELDELSMGMSSDFEVAVEQGATIVRIGTLMFGARPEAAQVRR